MDIKQFVEDNYSQYFGKGLLVNLIEDWERSKEQSLSKDDDVDYEILSVKYNGVIYQNKAKSVLGFGIWKDDKMEGWVALDHPKMEDNPTIYSVKYLPTGDIFKVGDEICQTGLEKKYTIEKFTFTDNLLKVCLNEGGFYQLKSISHVPKRVPLFTCNGDGVDIFREDKFYGVDEDFFLNFWWADEHTPENINIRYKNFSTEEAANAYIADNKPAYSLADVKSVCGKRDFIGKDFLIDNLKQLKQ